MKKVVFLMLGVLTLSSSSFKIQSNPESPSDCVQQSRNTILRAADRYNLDISRGGEHFDLMLDATMHYIVIATIIYET